MPYKERFQIMVTWEVDSTKIVYERVETVFVSLVADIGGLWALFAVILKFVDFFDDVHLYVITDLMRPYKTS